MVYLASISLRKSADDKERRFWYSFSFLGGNMSFLRCISFFLVIVVLTGCTTSTLIEDTRKAEIKITPTGEIIYRGRTISQKQIASFLRDDNVKRERTIHILVPLNQEQRDYVLMRSIVDTLKGAGYGRILFTTDRKATAKLK
jgi:biopolymer transport protein ExbD